MKTTVKSIAVLVVLAFACSALTQEKGEEKRESTDKATARDVELLQGEWRAYKVWWGGGNTEASAIDGGPITIKERKFTKKVFQNGKSVDQVATIERIDAAKTPKEIDLKVQSDDGKEKTVKLVYIVDEKSFEFFWTQDGAARPKNPWYLGRTGPFAFDDKGTFYQYKKVK